MFGPVSTGVRQPQNYHASATPLLLTVGWFVHYTPL